MKTVIAIAALAVAIATAGPAWGDMFITDTLAPGGGQPSPYNTQQHATPPFITDSLAPGGGQPSPYFTPVVPLSQANDFSWSDAGIGAAAATGALVALLGTTVVVGRRRERLAI